MNRNAHFKEEDLHKLRPQILREYDDFRARGLRMAKTSYLMRQGRQGTVFGVLAVDYAMHLLSF